jgi:hypothetical protein
MVCDNVLVFFLHGQNRFFSLKTALEFCHTLGHASPCWRINSLSYQQGFAFRAIHNEDFDRLAELGIGGETRPSGSNIP